MAYIGNQPSSGVFRKLDTLVFNGSTATFGLLAGGIAVSPGTATNLIISINGVVQEPVTSYDVSGSNITFSSTPDAGSTFFGVQLGSVGTVNIVTDGSITADKLSVTPIPVIKGGTGTESLTGLVKGNGTGALTEAVSGTDFQAPLVSGTNIRTVNGASLLTAGNLQLGASLVRSTRTANTVLDVADNSTLIDITSGTFTQTFSAAATLGSGWFCYIRNSGTGDITLDPNASELIDGLTSYVMYPGEVRLVQCDGVALRSVVLTAFARTFITSGTFIKPPGYSVIFTELWAGGGGGGKGTSYTTAGNGGAYMTRPVMASTIPPTVLVTVGAGGTPASVNTASGTAGGVSTLGTLVSTDSVSDSRGGNPGSAYPDIQGTFTGGLSATFSTGSTTLAGSSIFGGGAGGSFNLNATAIVPPGVSNFGGSGGSAGNAVSGSDGIIPGGGGGVTRTGPLSGAGARGEVRIWGVA